MSHKGTRTYVGSEELKPDENGKITLPKELQKEMLKFFMKTSIPRIKAAKMKAEQEKLAQQSENNSNHSNL